MGNQICGEAAQRPEGGEQRFGGGGGGGSSSNGVVHVAGRKRDFYVPTAELVDVCREGSGVVRLSPNGYELKKQPMSQKWMCDTCPTIYGPGFHSYGCRQDNYDVCPKCIIGPSCPKNHVLAKKMAGGHWGCDKCGRNGSPWEPSNGCRICNYDLCDGCYRKGKHELIHSTQQQAHIAAPPPPPPRTGRTRALFVGINYPGTSAELRGCVNDVKLIQMLLTDRLKFDISDKRIYVDEYLSGKTGEPTKANIIEGLKWLVDGAEPGDALFFHYSGHGTKVRDVDGDDDDGFDEALVPADYTRAGMILDDDIYDMCLKNLKPGVRLTAITDCCHSGTIMDLEHQFIWQGENFGRPKRRSRAAGNGVLTRDFMTASRKPCDADVVQLSGCKDEQTSADTHSSSFENPYDGPGVAGGACTNAFIELFTKYDDLSYGQILVNMQEVLRNKRYTQIPQMSTSCKVDMTSKFDMKAPLETS